MPTWETFKGKGRTGRTGHRSTEPEVSISNVGTIILNSYAARLLANSGQPRPATVVLLFDPEQRIIALRPPIGAGEDVDAYKLRWSGSTAVVSARSFANHYRLARGGLCRYRSHWDDGHGALLVPVTEPS